MTQTPGSQDWGGAAAEEQLLAWLEANTRVTHVARTPARAGVAAPWPQWVPDHLREALRAAGIAQPWRHQALGAQAIWEGRHTIITTATGSGKSLAVWLPVLSHLLLGQTAGAPGGGNALYLCPTKALAADQGAALNRLIGALTRRGIADTEGVAGGIGVGAVARCTVVDGDAHPEAKQWARAHANIVLSNPDWVHFGMLAGHRRWARFLRGLRYVIIDEAHGYRGLFGANVSMVLRRLLRLARHYGANPAVVGLSASIDRGGEAIETLAGLPEGSAVHIGETASPSGEITRVFATLEPPGSGAPGENGAQAPGEQGEPAPGERGVAPSSSLGQSAKIMAECANLGLRTLVFARSRVGAEVIAKAAAAHLPAHIAGKIDSYRSGYLPEDRRKLERGLREGELLGVATTNALELGMDVSGLDAVILAGWPGSRASYRQQTGRAGRAGKPGLSIFLARPDPLDSYLVNHPREILDAPEEPPILDPANPYVLRPHLCAAAAELPLADGDIEALGFAASTAAPLIEKGFLRRRPGGLYWNHARETSPHALVNLRGSNQLELALVDGESGEMIGTLDAASLDSHAHPGAHMLHRGKTYRVEGREDSTILLTHIKNPAYRTQPVEDKKITITKAHPPPAQNTSPRWGFGAVTVISRVTHYERYRLRDGQYVDSRRLDLAERVLPTASAWFTLTSGEIQALGLNAEELAGGIHAAEHALIGLLPLIANCDRADIGGISLPLHQQTGAATVFIYDGNPGGAGLTQAGLAQCEKWVGATLENLLECPCETGCPSCIQSPKCGNRNETLNKRAAIKILRLVLGGP